jgi:hypothetical protein
MKKIFYSLAAVLFFASSFAQIPDPCTGAGASQPISATSPCNCSEAVLSTSCSKSVYSSQSSSDAAIHLFLTTQNTWVRPTTPTLWQDVRSNMMALNGTFKHEFSTEFTTGPATTNVAALNICQVEQNCNAVCQDYEIFIKATPTCGTNLIIPVLITSTLDPTVKYRQYSVSPNTTYIVIRKIYYDGGGLDCYLSWTGGDGLSSLGTQVTSQHWFIWTIGGGLLPVHNLQLNARQLNSSVMIQWSTQQESGTSRFEVEKSTDGINFRKIGEQSAAGNSTTQKNYWIDDRSPSYENFYRIKAVDIDGKSSYSAVVKLVMKSGVQSFLTLSPNPAKDVINILIESKVSIDKSLYKIINSTGQLVQSGIVKIKKGINKLEQHIETLPSGMYIMNIQLNNQSITSKFIKE